MLGEKWKALNEKMDVVIQPFGEASVGEALGKEGSRVARAAFGRVAPRLLSGGSAN